MPHEDFIKSIDEAITEKGYANIVKRLNDYLKNEEPRPKVAREREIRTILDGLGKYQFLKVPDGQLIFKNPNYEVNQSLIAANKSSIDTNESLRVTNNSVIETNNSVRSLNTFQKWILGASILIASLTTLFIGLTYREQRKDKSQEQLKELVKKEQELLRVTQDIQTSLKEINSSIEKLKLDSVQVRLKK